MWGGGGGGGASIRRVPVLKFSFFLLAAVELCDGRRGADGGREWAVL